MSIYIKPIAAAYTNYQKRTKDFGPFEIEVPELQVEENARTQWSIFHARKPQGSTFTLPDTATFAQAQHPDVMLAEEKVEEESEYGTVNFSRVMQLSNYNLLARGVFFSFVPPHEPDEDAEDLDHASD
ncbi:hypothetical protein GN958_ATG17639 [Phytophthora infestans]|uniref:Uncharacterized protein n=1 Tax=Phytophthora infestans TaxID=4787 RepID=A0A8S9TXJ3_PHYIN|nr:hypothetical protein GN958_ATG17639 [Phytophthora infestans]